MAKLKVWPVYETEGPAYAKLREGGKEIKGFPDRDVAWFLSKMDAALAAIAMGANMNATKFRVRDEPVEIEVPNG